MLSEKCVSDFTSAYKEKQDVIEYMIRFGTPMQRAGASVIKDVAVGKLK